MYNRPLRKAVTHSLEMEGDAQTEGEGERDRGEDSDVKGPEDLDTVLQKVLEIHEKCHKKAKANISDAQQKQKQHYDKKHDTLKVSKLGASM